jgi:outer membrane protein assembly factor BamB
MGQTTLARRRFDPVPLFSFFLGDSAPLRDILLASLFFTLLISQDTNAENWDRFRGPNGAGQSDATGIPSQWKPENILWRQPLANVGHSSPVVWDDRLFLLSAENETGTQIVHAFDAITGEPIWERRMEAGVHPFNGLNSMASSTPAVDAEHLYVMWLADGRVRLAAFTHDGEEAWQRDIGAFKEEHGFGKSPVVVDGVVWVANDNDGESAIVAVDGKTGDTRYTIPRPSGTTPFASPCLLDPAAPNKLLLTLSTASGLSAIDPETGKVAWQGLNEQIPLRTVASPIVAGGMVIVACGQGGNGKWLVAARPGDAIHEPQEMYRLDKNVPNVPTPVVAGDLLFLWHDRGVVSCHEVATGKQIWRERVGGDFHSSPIRIGERIMGVSRQGEAIVMAADRKFELLGRNNVDDLVVATPAVSNNRLYIRGESAVVCIGTPPSKSEQ